MNAWEHAAAVHTVRDCLSATLNRGLWFTAPGLAKATGLDARLVAHALFRLDLNNEIETSPASMTEVWTRYRIG